MLAHKTQTSQYITDKKLLRKNLHTFLWDVIQYTHTVTQNSQGEWIKGNLYEFKVENSKTQCFNGKRSYKLAYKVDQKKEASMASSSSSSSSTPLLLLCLLLLLTLKSSVSVLAISKSDCNVKPGSSLSASSQNNASWVSPSGEFAFGFQRLDPPYEENLFLLAIWFAKIPTNTVVWSANDFPAKEGSKVTLTNKGELELYDPQGNSIKKFGNGTGDSSTCAAMLDTGNFAILGENSSPLWESFSEPTDTILPGQVLGKGGRLVARESENNYSDGRFQLRMQDDGNLVLYSVSTPTEVIYGAYWASGTMHPNSSSELVFDEAGLIYVREGTRRLHNLTTKNMGSNEEFYHMARIDYDGIFK